MNKKYQGVMPPDHITNILRPIGESIFSRPIYWTLSEDIQEKILLRIREKLTHLLSFRDDRVLAIHGALLVENSIDSHLADFIPGYKNLLDNSNYTFSMKIDLSKAMALTPTRIYESAHIIRKTRNDFAHNLEIKSFSDVPKRVQAAKQKLKEFFPKTDDKLSNSEIFSNLISEVTIAIEIYRPSIQHLNSLIHSGDESLENILRKFNDLKNENG